MSARVGLASSANQSKAAAGKRQKHRASIQPLESKAETRAKLASAKVPETGSVGLQPHNHETIRMAWLEVVAEIKLANEAARARRNQEAQPKPVREPVVFLEFVQVVEEIPAIAPAPQPAPVVETPVLLLPAITDTKARKLWRDRNHEIAGYRLRAGGPVSLRESGDVIELPAPQPDYAAEAAAARAAIRAEYERETGEKLPERKPIDLGRHYLWVRDEDGNMQKRYVS